MDGRAAVGPGDRVVPDLWGPLVRLVLVGINPGRRSGALRRHFAGPGNRFWPALRAAGLVPPDVGVFSQHLLPDLGIGVTNVVPRTTATAAELRLDEVRAGGAALLPKLALWRPRVVAVLGVTAYRAAFGVPRAHTGPQEAVPPGADPSGARWWVLPNPSGLNAHARPEDHAAGLRAAALAAGLIAPGSPVRDGEAPGDVPKRGRRGR